jgi:hypothetical protein
MREWMSAGCRLAFLIDPAGKQAFVYRQGSEAPEAVCLEARLSGEDVLPGFELDLAFLKD